KPLGNLIIDAWQAVDSLFPALQFNKYNAFLVFHAGSGRDVDLVSSLGYDPTPFDLPSITFNLKTLRNYVGDQSYAGVPVSKGSFRITNTMLLPETETRVFSSNGLTDTLQGSINGLLANSFGSYLGLPDLFNTSTGASAIGQFGLMDIAGGFVFYSGMFPPEPSAWEKIYLGWVTPITVSPGTSTLTLPAVGLKTGRDTVYKVPISDREYFLIENRMRDPKSDGLHLSIRTGGKTITRFFAKDTVGFNFQETNLIAGSVIDVDDFDWALPSATAEADSNYVGGGILIWHVDEDVIAQGLATNSVNADATHRGLNLEEADGSPDLGRTYDFLSAGSGTELGYQQDFWYSGNPIPTYTNVFDKNSRPNSRSNSGALSLVTIRDFSKRLPRMTATVDIGDNSAKRISALSRSLPAQTSATPPVTIGSTIFMGVDGKILAFRNDGSRAVKDTTGILSSKGGAMAPAVTMVGNNYFVAGSQDSTLTILNVADQNGDGLFDSVTLVPLTQVGSSGSTKVQISGVLTTAPMFADLSVVPQVVVGTSVGEVWAFSYGGVLQSRTTVSSSPVTSLAQLPSASLSRPTDLFFTSGGRLYRGTFGDVNSVSRGDSSLPWLCVGVVSRSGNIVVVAQSGGQVVKAFSSDLSQQIFESRLSGNGIVSVAAADIDGDGEKDVVLVSADRITVLNRTGTYLSGYPVFAPTGFHFVGAPMIADINGDLQMEIVASVSSGNLMAYDKDGRTVSGYPIKLASPGETSLALMPTVSGNLGILGLTAPQSIQVVPLGSSSAAASTSSMQAVELTKPYRADLIAWSQYLKDSRHSDYDGTAGGSTPISTEFFPHSRVYNWPNPVYGSTTRIRYFTSEDAAISIKILDLAGVKIAELQSTSRGGMDGEIPWDVSKIQSGVYFARVEAKGASHSDVAVIKIAVVK
ncbi:MAG TPA: FG-GAP-like repeat-containing protein, partial [Bacteroidota bacterium]|nr:FG-GAP-like repeat-containing protein [Bacteroidota bacterium]